MAVFERLARFLCFRGVKVMVFTSGVVWRVRSASGGYEKRATFLCKTYDFLFIGLLATQEPKKRLNRGSRARGAGRPVFQRCGVVVANRLAQCAWSVFEVFPM